MMEFIATNFNLPTIIVAALVFGALGWVVWHTHKHGGGCSCGGDCSHCLPLNTEPQGARAETLGSRSFFK